VDAPQADAKLIDSLRGSVGRRLGLHQDKLSIKSCNVRAKVDLLTLYHLIGNERCASGVGDHIEAVDDVSDEEREEPRRMAVREFQKL
jgi:hypothetical protein